MVGENFVENFGIYLSEMAKNSSRVQAVRGSDGAVGTQVDCILITIKYMYICSPKCYLPILWYLDSKMIIKIILFCVMFLVFAIENIFEYKTALIWINRIF